MKRIVALLFATVIATVLVARIRALIPPPSTYADTTAAIHNITIPEGYREWKLVSVAQENGNLNDIRSVLGNDAAFKALRDGKDHLPDGAVIARLAWSYTPSAENNKAFGREQSFIAGPPTNVQFIIKDSHKYAATGGWGFAQFTGGRPANEAVANTCFSCHQPVRERDFVFTHYAP